MPDLAAKRVVTAGGFRVELDLSSQVLAVEAPEERDWHLRAGRYQRGQKVEAPLHATLAEARSEGFLSASVLAQKAKIFDDGLYAAVEIAAQEGAGLHAGKAWLLKTVAAALAGARQGAEQARLLVLGAARLGQVAVESATPDLQRQVEIGVERFLEDELRSKPIGFYTWSEPLARIFRQDRLLQQELGRDVAEALLRALQADSGAREAYQRHLRLISRLTNPFAGPDLLGAEAPDRTLPTLGPAPTFSFFPPSAAHETELVGRLFGDGPIPDGFVLADEMIRQIRSRQLDLTPRPDSGWYDHQTWALEPLVVPERMPEAPRLALNEPYRKLLLGLFKGLLTLTRETHVKQLAIPNRGASLGRREVVISIAPELAAEPLPTFYLRRALAYRFVRGVLEEGFGAEAVARLHRLTPAGPVAATLAAELDEIEARFVGAHVLVSRQLGLAPDAAAGPEPGASAAATRFESWMSRLEADPDLGQDLRAMVPVFWDRGRRKTKVWVFLGWCSRPIEVSFEERPRATILDSRGRPAAEGAVRIEWGTLDPQVVYPVTAELYVDRILDRDEFRALCDGSPTRAEIQRRLAGPVAGPGLDWGTYRAPTARETPTRPSRSEQPRESARSVRCAACGRSASVATGEYGEFGSRNLDLRPGAPLRSSMSEWIQACGGCRRCAWDLGFPDPAAKTLVASQDYLRQFEDPAYPELARLFLCRAMLDEAQGAPAAAARALVYAAWDCDDHLQAAAAAACRSRAADRLREAFAEEPMPQYETARYVDLLRRAGRRDEARQAVAAVPPSTGDATLREVLAFQQALLDRGDAESHSLQEATVFGWLSASGRAATRAEPDLDTVLQALRHAQPAVRGWALAHGDVITSAAAGLSETQVTLLAAAVSPPDTAVFALETLADGGHVVALLGALDASHEGVVGRLLPRAPAMARAPGAAEAARIARRGSSANIKEFATRILFAAEGSPAAALRPELEHPDAAVRAATVIELHRTATEDAMLLVKRALREDPAPAVRRDAAMRLGLRLDPGVVTCLIEALEREADDGVRAQVAVSFACLVAQPDYRPASAELDDLRARIEAVWNAQPRPGQEVRSESVGSVSPLERCRDALRAKSAGAA